MVDSKIHFKDKTFGKDQDLGNIVHAYDGFIMGVAFVLKVCFQPLSCACRAFFI